MMFHYTHEGNVFNPGFNFYINPSIKNLWFRIVYCSVDLNTYVQKIIYFRFRIFAWPMIIFDASNGNIIDRYLMVKDMRIVSRDVYEDYVVPNIKELGIKVVNGNS